VSGEGQAAPEPATAVVRRPLASRGKPWAWALARRLTAWGASPNFISALSVVCAAGAGIAFIAAGRATTALAAAVCYVAAVAGLQLRLLANLMDGMVAIEGGRGSKTGELWNDLPDRFADALVFIGAGYSIPALAAGIPLGWTAAVAAVITAYVRVLGAAAGARQCFLGPAAKPHRMAAMTVAALLAAAVGFSDRTWSADVLAIALLLVVVGCAVTVCRRLVHIAADLRQRP
jgi:phosphatidylglycerophosphate synthase